MCKLSAIKNSWEISESGESVLFGIESAYQALAIAQAYGLVVTEFNGDKSWQAANHEPNQSQQVKQSQKSND